MALNQIEFLRSPSVSVTNGTKEITVTGSVDCSGVYSGTAIFINDNQVVEAVSGTGFNPVTGESTITLRYKWDRPTVTAGTLIGFNSIEGLNSAVTRLNEILNAIPDFTQFAGAGLIYSDGNGGYSIKQITTFGESVINAADAAALNAMLGNPDFSPVSGFAGVLKKDALDNYSLISSTTFGESLLTQADATTARATLDITDPSAFGANLIVQTDAASARGVLNITDPSAFGESLITQADAASARSTLGVNSATESTEGLIRKQTLAEALDGTDDSGAMSSIRVHQAFQQYGLGADSVAVATQDLDLGRSTGCYIASLSTNKPPASASEGFWKTLQYDLANYSLQEWTDFGAALPRKFFRTEASGVFTDWFEVHTTSSLVDAQNVSGSNIPPNNTVAGSSLSPPQTGTWRNVCGSDVANNGYGLFKKD